MLTVMLRLNKSEANGTYRYLVQCDCGEAKTASTGSLRYGRTKSCGCLQRRKGACSPAYKHGRSKTKDYYNELAIKQNYGIEYADYLAMMEAQENKCAICGESPRNDGRKKRLNIDHCHTTGAVRGLLCNACNRGLGFFRDNRDTLQNAINYLAR